MPNRKASPRRPHRAGRDRGGERELAELLDRVARLEERMGRLEAGKAAPGDGRASVAKAGRKVKRCPGCGLPLRRRAGRCAACDRPIDR